MASCKYISSRTGLCEFTSFCDSISISSIPQQCMANGLSYDELAEEESIVTSLEIILSGFPRMVGLSFFPMLRQLQILGQDIKRIEGLESCPLLQELWVVECKLTVSFFYFQHVTYEYLTAKGNVTLLSSGAHSL